jgi:putative FmdB family regulatory protein
VPIYEFYCPDCDTLYSFFSSRIDTEARPDCPGCGRPRLERRPARFAALSGGGGEGGDEEGGLGGVDDERLGAAFESALGDAEAAGDDPRALARVFRSVGEAAGLEPGPQMEEMLRRLEAGEDPERLEEEMGDAFDDVAEVAEAGDGAGGEGDPLADLFREKRRRRRRRPKVDEELHFL